MQEYQGVLQEYVAREHVAKEFGHRAVQLSNGGLGIRGGLAVEVSEVKGAGPTLRFIASDETVDRYNEVIKLNGWDLANYRKNPVVVDSHDYSSVGNILGRSVSVEIQGEKLVNTVQFAVENPLGRLAYDLARGGFIKSESVGFIPIEWTRGNESKGEPYRTYTRQELIEISLVAVPANPGATMALAVKSGAVTRARLEELREFLTTEAQRHREFRVNESSDGNASTPAAESDCVRSLRRMHKEIREVLQCM
jgi:HK97 family phage prohead protease